MTLFVDYKEVFILRRFYNFNLDKKKNEINNCNHRNAFHDRIQLPVTVATAKKGILSIVINKVVTTKSFYRSGCGCAIM
jgi:hypothetical protein